MDRGIKAILAALLIALPAASFAGMARQAGITYAVMGKWEKALDAIPSDTASPAERYFRALSLRNTGRLSESLAEFGKLAGGTGAFSAAAAERAVEYAYESGRWEMAAGFAGKHGGEKLADPDAFAYRTGQSAFNLGRFEVAKPLLEKAGGASRPYALHTLALIHFSEGDYASAIKALGEGVEAANKADDQGVKDALTDRLRLVAGRIIHHAAVTGRDMTPAKKEKLLKLAVAQLSLIKQESSFYAEAMRTAGWCAVEMNDTVRALASFDTASVADPQNAHEDAWASGRLFERLGFYDEAAASYAKAGLLATKRAESFDSPGEPFRFDLKAASTPVGRLMTLLDTLGQNRDALYESVREALSAARLKAERLDRAGKSLESMAARIDSNASELDNLDRELYLYLDSMPPDALYPKSDRQRIGAVLDGKERLTLELAKTRTGIRSLEKSRSWTNTNETNRRRVAQLWERLNRAAHDLNQADLAFLEALKKRVSMREREIAELLAKRREENESLKTPLKAALEILKRERDALETALSGTKILQERAEALEKRIAELKAEILETLAADEKLEREALAGEARLRADGFALDEAQALHLLKRPGEGRGDR